ncbi:radical SAM protein [Thermococcus sp.]
MNKIEIKQQYKQSFYNLLLSLNENEFILFNTLSNAVVRIDKEIKEILEKGDFDKLNSALLEQMKKVHVIVNKELNEVNLIRTWRKTHLKNMYLNPRVGLTLVMTYSCNLACPYCYEGDKKAKGGLLTPEKIDTILAFAKKHKVSGRDLKISVTFYGGEPLLNWKGCKYTLKELEKMKEDNVITDYFAGFITNGTLITEKVIDAINNYNISSMQITLDGPKDIHDKRRIKINGEGTFEEIIENIKLLKREVTNEKFHLGLRINVDKTNYKRIPELLDFLKKEGLGNIGISYGIVRGNIPYCSTCMDTPFFVGQDLSKYLTFLWKEAYKRGFQIATRHNLKVSYCMYDRPFSYAIDPNLKVYPCWEMVGEDKYCIWKDY